jgi:hypothetical protein
VEDLWKINNTIQSCVNFGNVSREKVLHKPWVTPKWTRERSYGRKNSFPHIDSTESKKEPQPPIFISWNSKKKKATTETQLGRALNITTIKTKETPETTTSANVCNGVNVLPKDNTWVEDTGIPVQNGTCNRSGENTDDTVAVHHSQPQQSKIQEATWEIEEMKIPQQEQKKAQCKMSSRLKKPVIKSDDFLWFTRTSGISQFYIKIFEV